MNLEQAKEFYEQWRTPECHDLKSVSLRFSVAFAQQCVEAERSRIRSGIEAIDDAMDIIDAALAVVDQEGK